MGDKLVFTFEQLPLIDEISNLVLTISQKSIENNLKNYPEEFELFRKTLG